MHTRGKGIIISYCKIVVNMVCGVILSSALLRMLGDTEYGIYQTVAAFANYLILLEFGVGTVMVRNISMCRGSGAGEEEIQRHITTNWTLTGILAMFLVLVSVLFYCALPRIYANSMTAEQILHGKRIFAVSVGHLLTTFLIHTVNAIILSYEDYTFGSLQSTIRTMGRTVMLLVLLLFVRNALVIVWVDAALGAICLLSSCRYCRKKLNIKLHFAKCDPVILRASAPLALAVFMQGIVNQANNNVAKILVGAFLSPESVSLYSVALYIYSIFLSLVNVASSMYVPTVTQKVGCGLRGKDLAKELIPPCRLTALLGGLVLFGFMALGGQFIEILYGEAYLIAWPIAIILMAPAYIDTVVDVMVHVLNAMNKRMMRSVVLVLTTVLNIVCTVICLKRWGILETAIATSSCTVIGPILIMNLYYVKVIKVPMLWIFRQAFRGILLYLVIGAAAAMVAGHLIKNVYLSFLAGGVIFVIVALGGYFLFGMTEIEKSKVKNVIHKFMK